MVLNSRVYMHKLSSQIPKDPFNRGINYLWNSLRDVYKKFQKISFKVGTKSGDGCCSANI